MTIMSLWSVDIVDEFYSVFLDIECRWKCPDGEREAALQHGTDKLDSDWEPEWTPHLGVRGTVEVLHERRNYWAEEGAGGTVWLFGHLRLAVRVVERYDLQGFPFDLQDMNLLLHCYNATMCPLEHDMSTAVNVEYAGCGLPDFAFLPALPAVHRLIPPSEQPHGHSSIHVVLFYQRRAAYFAWNVFSMLLVISLCSAASWSVHFREVGERLSLDVTLLLVAVAFKLVISDLTPNLSYLTMLDIYALACVGQLFLAVSLHAAVGFLFEDCDTLSGDCKFRFLTYTANSSFVLGDWMPEAYACDYYMLGCHLAIFFGFNFWYALRVAQIRWRIRHRFRADRLCTQPGGALEGYTPSRFVFMQPTGRPELDIPAELSGSQPPEPVEVASGPRWYHRASTMRNSDRRGT